MFKKNKYICVVKKKRQKKERNPTVGMCDNLHFCMPEHTYIHYVRDETRWIFYDAHIIQTCNAQSSFRCTLTVVDQNSHIKRMQRKYLYFQSKRQKRAWELYLTACWKWGAGSHTIVKICARVWAPEAASLSCR